MIVGTGDLAKAINDRSGALFFCSGVSNSQETEYAAFKRERELLMVQDKSLCLFYFGSISMYTVSSPYTRHKAKMELLIKSNWNHYNIVRLGNISWGSNPNTFLNYIRGRKERGESYEVLDEYRYMIDEDQLNLICSSLPLHGQNEINVFGKMAKVKDLI